MTQTGVSPLKLQRKKDHTFLGFLLLAAYPVLNSGFPLATPDRKEQDWEAQSIQCVKETGKGFVSNSIG